MEEKQKLKPLGNNWFNILVRVFLAYSNIKDKNNKYTWKEHIKKFNNANKGGIQF